MGSLETLHEKCPYSELLWSVFSRIQTEYGYSVRMLKNTDQSNVEQALFLHSGSRIPNIPNVPIWSPRKHQKTFGFLMFSGGWKGNIGKKKVNMDALILLFTCLLFLRLSYVSPVSL